MNFDVAIVGGGPAGLSAAKRAANLGCKVALFEKSREIGYPVHTSGGSWIDELEKLNVPTKFIHPIKSIEFIANKSTAVFKYDVPKNCVLDIRGYYQYLAEQASLAGTKIFVNATVLGPIISNNFVRGINVNINGEQHIVHSKLVIDASGFNAIIARKAGLLDKFKLYGIGAEYELIAPSWNQEKVYLILGSKIAPAGYGWIFPRGDHRVRVGIATIRPISKTSPVKYLDDFLSSNNDIVQNLRPYSEIEFHQGFIPNNGILPKTVSNGLIVVGDAAGQILAIAGEGIRFALDIGDIAGLVAGKAILNKKYNEDFLAGYEKKWREKYALRFKISYEVNKRLRNYTDEDWEEKVRILSHLSPDLLAGILKGDFTTKFFFKAIMQQPKLVSSSTFKIIKKILGINVKKKTIT